MSLRVLNRTSSLAAAKSLARTVRQPVASASVRHYSAAQDDKQVEPKQKANAIIDALPGNSLISKTGYLTLGTGLATFLISKEIYVLNEETLVLIAFGGLMTGLLSYMREPYKAMADEHINRIKNVLTKAREGHKNAVRSRIDQVGEMKDIVKTTKDLFALSKETARLEAEAFELKQKIAVASEVKSVLDSWVRYEASVREREQRKLADQVIAKIMGELEDPKVQKQILDQAVSDVERIARA
ncbi:hypothetical protein BZG36_03122 [Bifiguratus adelaidae]|uniref:ATP synthase subunit 4 n=1 Tax=Bifiguratus adelaidae TaxID=1938954 RepID=A0A261Y0X8_9FUNG|nr:hypothetical protein BZG36_03122 [Bifiguratus adelaidae]